MRAASSRVPASLRKALAGKRLIFTLSPGRSGTFFLHLLAAGAADVESRHEPDPNFADVMRDCHCDRSLASDFWVERKLPAIAANSRPVYLETSHLFGLGFAEELLRLGVVPDLLVLRRPHRQVATSLLQVGTVPGRSPLAERYYLKPGDRGVPALNGWERMADYQLCYWYCVEFERRVRRYQGLFAQAGSRVLELSLEELPTATCFRRLHRFLTGSTPTLAAWRHFLRHRGLRPNRKLEEKHRAGVQIPYDRESLERAVLEALKSGSFPSSEAA